MSTNVSPPDPRALELPVDAATFASALLEWYQRERRTLPWRDTHDAYPVWVSEIMLQQTRVDRVVPYFKRFLRAFPTLQDLAAAEETELLKLWAGLGYYHRARNLLVTARELVEKHCGKFPTDFQTAVSLPGVGRYTAGAVLSVAFGVPLPVCDGNVKRVIARYLGIEEPMRPALENRVWVLLEELVANPRVSPNIRDFNQSLMELGATVCTPRKPNCPDCPLAETCRARATGKQELLPIPLKRRPARHIHMVAAVVCRDGTFLLHRNHRSELPQGFWEFPMVAGQPGTDLESRFSESLGLKVHILQAHSPVRHQITFRKLRLHPVSCDLAGPAPTDADWNWVSLEPPEVPVPAYVSKILHAARRKSD